MKLYFGSPINNIKQIYKGKFLTQYKAIASCFCIDKNDLFGQFNKKYTSINWSYNIWNLSIKQLQKNKIPKYIQIYNNAKDWIQTDGNSTGYIYELDTDEYIENHLQQFNDSDIKIECIYTGNKKLSVKLTHQIDIDWNCIYKKFMSNRFGFANIGEGKFEPPYSIQILKQKYPKLLKDEIHVWRAKKQIELIHEEPDFEQQKRIFYNWNLMSKKNKETSDRKSKQLFGIDNIQHHRIIMQNKWFNENYKQLSQIRNIYDKRDMQLNGWKFIHLSKSKEKLTLVPRIPKNTMKFDKEHKQFNQDNKIKRICVSNSILGAISAISSKIKKNDVYYVHLLKPKTIINNSQVAKFVPDAISTGQIWILDDEITTEIVGKITIKSQLPYIYTFVKDDDWFCCNDYYDYNLEII